MSELINVILERLQTLFNPETIGTQLVDFMIDLIIALITFAAFYLAWVIIRHDPDYLQEPLPRVVITQVNDYNVALALQAWINDERIHIEKRFEL